MLVNPDSVTPSTVDSRLIQSAARLSIIAMNSWAWKPSMSLEPRYVPGAVALPLPSLPVMAFPGEPTAPRSTSRPFTGASFRVVHDLEVVEDPEAVFPTGEAVRSWRDR